MSNKEKFIIKKREKVSKTLRFPNDLVSQLQQIATKEDISFNQLVVQCCEYALRYLPENQDAEKQ